MKLFIFTVLFVLTSNQAKAVYGVDGRKDFYKLSSAQQTVAQAIAYQVDKHELRGWTFQRYWRVVTRPLRDRGVCDRERFSDQPSIRPDCTGILIAPKLLLTAGNCTTEHYCWNDLFYWMFGHNLEGPPTEGEFKKHKNNFYKCERVVERVFNPSTGVSYAVLELKREVSVAQPVKLARDHSLENDEELIAFGHIRGTPLKAADGAFALDQDSSHFITNTDILGENLGSGIFKKNTLELVGILVYGSRTFENRDEECRESSVFQDSQGKELAIKTSFLSDILERLKE